MFAYGGFESALVPAAKAKTPKQDGPFALLVGVSVCLVVYTLLQWVVVGVPPHPNGPAGPTVPPHLEQQALAKAAEPIAGRPGAVFLTLGALISVGGYLVGAALVPRLTYAMALRGDAPPALGFVHPV